MMKYLRIIKGNKSHASGFEFQFDKVNIAPIWNPNENTPEKQGGFNITNEESAIRWMIRGDTLCDVEIPADAEIIQSESESTPGGVFRVNKIILRNPRPITEQLAIELYKKSNLPEPTYFKILTIAGCKQFERLQDLIIAEKINQSNIDEAIKTYTEYSNSMHGYSEFELHYKTLHKLNCILNERKRLY